MNLKNELEKLKRYVGVDVEKFNEQLERIYDGCGSAAETKEARAFVKKLLAEESAKVEAEVNALTVRMMLGDDAEIIPLSYIAKNYFKKSRSWLSQRVNAHTVNGKPASFTREELSKFNFALQDVSKRIGSIAI